MLNQDEGFKLSVHLGLFGFAVACTLYNVGAALHSKAARNITSVVVYSALAVYEVLQMEIHWKACHCGDAEVVNHETGSDAITVTYGPPIAHIAQSVAYDGHVTRQHPCPHSSTVTSR